VFAGIDYHKKFSVVTLGDKDGNVLQQTRLENNNKAVRNFFAHSRGLQCAIESCRGYEWLVELLQELGVRVSVANTYGVRLIADSRCKTDKIDSRILMELLSKGFLPTSYQPTKDERSLREQLRWRTQLVRTRTAYKNKAHSFMDKENRPSKLDSKKDRRVLKESALSPSRQPLLKESLEIIDFLDEHVSLRDVELERECNQRPDATLLKTIPGVGDIAALMLLAEIGDVSRFRKAEDVAAFVGLVPRVYSSAQTRRTGNITKHGSGMLRWVMVQAAWVAIQRCGALRQRYERIGKKRGKRVAAVAIARTLVEIAYHVLKDKKGFEESKLALG
jgi:transposase